MSLVSASSFRKFRLKIMVLTLIFAIRWISAILFSFQQFYFHSRSWVQVSGPLWKWKNCWQSDYDAEGARIYRELIRRQRSGRLSENLDGRLEDVVFVCEIQKVDFILLLIWFYCGICLADWKSFGEQWRSRSRRKIHRPCMGTTHKFSVGHWKKEYLWKCLRQERIGGRPLVIHLERSIFYFCIRICCALIRDLVVDCVPS